MQAEYSQKPTSAPARAHVAIAEMKSASREVRSPSENPVAHRADGWTAAEVPGRTIRRYEAQRTAVVGSGRCTDGKRLSNVNMSEFSMV